MKQYFIAGTDTAVGKTHVAVGLLQKFNQQGYTTIALKPVSAGGSDFNGVLRNEDAVLLQHAASVKMSDKDINPIFLPAAVSPNIAAVQCNYTLTANDIINASQKTLNLAADRAVIEGAGGWLVPLNDRETMADVVAAMSWPVILVVGLRLGCLNHTLLTYQAIRNAGVDCVAWVANCITPEMPAQAENIETLKKKLACPLLGVVNYQQPAAEVLDLQYL